MPVSPEAGVRLAAEVLRIYLEAELIMLQRVSRRVMRGIEEDGWAERKLAEIQAVRRELRQTLRSLNGASTAVLRDAVMEAHELGVLEASRELRELGRAVVPVGSSPRAVQLLINEAIGNLSAMNPRILRVTEDAYRRAVQRASAQVLLGTSTRRQAAQSVLNELADKGIRGFVDSAGRAWDMASYAEMSTRAATGRAAIMGHGDAIRATGHDLVIVSDAPQECPLCRDWEGQILSVSGNSSRHASLYEAEGAGLFHPGCRHSIGIYVAGFTRSFGDTEDPIGNEERMQQRYLERGVRRWKRRDAVGDASAAPKAREWQQRLTEHVKRNDLKRLRHRESPTGAR